MILFDCSLKCTGKENVSDRHESESHEEGKTRRIYVSEQESKKLDMKREIIA